MKIARRSRKLTMEPELDEAIDLGPLFIDAVALFRDSIRAYAEGDVDLARTLHRRDREIDQMNHDIADDLTTKMADNPIASPLSQFTFHRAAS